MTLYETDPSSTVWPVSVSLLNLSAFLSLDGLDQSEMNPCSELRNDILKEELAKESREVEVRVCPKV